VEVGVDDSPAQRRDGRGARVRDAARADDRPVARADEVDLAAASALITQKLEPVLRK
jgi:hypothetical protein